MSHLEPVRHIRSAPSLRTLERYVKKQALAEHFSVSTSTVDRWQRMPGFPAYRPFGPGGMVRYRLSEVEGYFNSP